MVLVKCTFQHIHKAAFFEGWKKYDKKVNKLNVNNKEKDINKKKPELRNTQIFCVHMYVKLNTTPDSWYLG